MDGAVVVTLCQNMAEVKYQMEIEQHISTTEGSQQLLLSRTDYSAKWYTNDEYEFLSLEIEILTAYMTANKRCQTRHTWTDRQTDR